MRFVIAFLALLVLAAPLSAQPAEPPIVAEARAFMASYANALRAGDRAGIAARYHGDGARFLGHGSSRLETPAQIAATYASPDWQPPHRFEWRDLAYEAVGPDAVVVTGLFLWTPREGAQALTFSYTGLLRHQNGQLRIRLEDESMAPPRPPSPPPPPPPPAPAPPAH